MTELTITCAPGSCEANPPIHPLQPSQPQSSSSITRTSLPPSRRHNSNPLSPMSGTTTSTTLPTMVTTTSLTRSSSSTQPALTGVGPSGLGGPSPTSILPTSTTTTTVVTTNSGVSQLQQQTPPNLANLTGSMSGEGYAQQDDECLDLMASVDAASANELAVSMNPFKMVFPGHLEIEYREWAHMRYIPYAHFLSGDLFTYGMLDPTVSIMIMHVVAFIQVVTFLLMSMKRFYPYRRHMVLVMGLHAFFWTGMTTQQAVERISTMHQNNFITLPYYCAFACIMTTQVPVRWSIAIFCILPVLNALWRVLVYYSLPSASVMLVWWWMIAFWAYVFERILRQLFSWLKKLEAIQERLKEQQQQTQSLLGALITPSLLEHLVTCTKQLPRDQSEESSTKSETEESLSGNSALSPAASQFATSAEFVVVNLHPTPWGKIKEITPPMVKIMNDTAERYSFRRVGVTPTRFGCVRFRTDRNGSTFPVFCLIKAMLEACEPVSEALPDFYLSFGFHAAPALSGVVVTSHVCRHIVLSEGIALAHELASVAGSDPEHGRVYLFRSALPSLGVPDLDPEIFPSGFASSLLAKTNVPNDAVLALPVRQTTLPPELLAPPLVEAPHVDTGLAIQTLLSLLRKSYATATNRKLGPVPKIIWKGVFTRKGITFAYPIHETGYRLFVINAVPELLLILGGCQLFCGLWSVISLLTIVWPCGPSLPGGLAPYVFGHMFLFFVTCLVMSRLRNLLRHTQFHYGAVSFHTFQLFMLMLCHYGLSLASVYMQPNLSLASNWDVFAASITGHSKSTSFDNQICINMLYNMTFFLLFAIWFCMAAAPLFIPTTYRFATISALFLIHTITNSLLFHHTDFMEIGVVITVFTMLLTVEGLVRLFYLALLMANRCRLDIEQQPEMQHRHLVMLASMPQRLYDAPHHTCTHPVAGLLCISFPTVESLLHTLSQDHSGIIGDCVSLINIVQNTLPQLPLDASIVHMSLSNGNPGLILLMLPKGITMEGFQQTIRNAAQLIGFAILNQPIHHLKCPVTFKMSYSVAPLREWTMAGAHLLSESCTKRTEDLLNECLINSIIFSQTSSSLDDSNILGETQSQSSSCMGFPPIASCTNGRLINSTPTVPISTNASMRPCLSDPRSLPNVEEEVKTASAVQMLGAYSIAPPRHYSFIAMIWAFPFAPLFADTHAYPQLTVLDENAFLPSCPTGGAQTFNSSYLADIRAVFVHLKEQNGSITLHQGNHHFGLHVLVIHDTYQECTTLASDLWDIITTANPDTRCVGLGVAVGPTDGTIPLIHSPLAQEALKLSQLNVLHPIASSQFGKHVLMSAESGKWAQSYYSVKPLINESSRVYRLAGKLKEARIPPLPFFTSLPSLPLPSTSLPFLQPRTAEWMYALRESEQSSPYLHYKTAYALLLEGDYVGADQAIQKYLQDHPRDGDALRLFAAIRESRPYTPSSALTVGTGSATLGDTRASPRTTPPNIDGLDTTAMALNNSASKVDNTDAVGLSASSEEQISVSVAD